MELDIAWLNRLIPACERSALVEVLNKSLPGNSLEGVHVEFSRLLEQMQASMKTVTLSTDDEEQQRMYELVERVFLRTLRLEGTKSVNSTHNQVNFMGLINNNEFCKSLLALSCEVCTQTQD